MRPSFLSLATVLCVLLSTQSAHAQDRSGFTLLLSLGYGMQSGGEIEVEDNFTGETRTYGGDTVDGLAGLNVGIGGFISRDVALMLRLSGTNVTQDYVDSSRRDNETDVVSGVMAFDVQYWVTDRVNVEVGAGIGILSTDDHDERGVGIMGAIGYSFVLRGKYSLQVGVEDAVYYNDGLTVNSLGLCIGFQFL